jgi:hypothetical protein
MGDANSMGKTFGCWQRWPIPLRGRDMKRQAIGNDQPQIAKSTLQAVAYLIKQNDPARLRAFLAKHTRTERIAIKRQLQRNST